MVSPWESRRRLPPGAGQSIVTGRRRPRGPGRGAYTGPVDTAQLETFCAVVESASFSAAARGLGLTQPTVSRRIKRLEKELGTTLVHRREGGIAPTPTGRRFLTFARSTLREYETFRAVHRPSALSGTVQVLTSTTPAESLVPELVTRFTTHHPKVDVEVEVVDSAQVLSRLRGSRWDVGFVGADPGDGALRVEPVGQDEIVLAVPGTHALACWSAIPLEALAGERLILRRRGSGTLRSFQDALAAHGLKLPRQASTTRLGSTHAVLAAVEAGLGIGVLSLRVLEHHRPEGVTAVRLVGVPVVRSLYLVYLTDREHPPAVQGFIDFALEVGRGRP